MKKIILCVCSVMLLLVGCNNKGNKAKIDESKVIVEIPDANFKAYLLENFDKNSDGKISLAEAKRVKEINCSGKNIKDLTGIDKFANIVSLDCSNNQLDDIEIQYNKKLNKINTKGNNDSFVIYIGMSSQLKNPKFKPLQANKPPDNVSVALYILDPKKCTVDEDITSVTIYFED